MPAPLDDLVHLLDLEQLEVNLFRGVSPDTARERVYGGEVLAQALMAVGRTVPADRGVHSMHAYFLKLGDPSVPIVYDVDRIRDGRSFTTRRVVAIQHGEAIFNLAASFQVQEEGPEHFDRMPAVPPAEACRRASTGRRRRPSRSTGGTRPTWSPRSSCARPPAR